MVCVLENPGFCAALLRIKLARSLENFKEDILHNIFRFSGVAKNSQRNFQNKPVKTAKENGYSVGMALTELFHQVFVGHSSCSYNRNVEGGGCRVWYKGLVLHHSNPFVETDSASRTHRLSARRRRDIGRTPSLPYACMSGNLYQTAGNLR